MTAHHVAPAVTPHATMGIMGATADGHHAGGTPHHAAGHGAAPTPATSLELRPAPHLRWAVLVVAGVVSALFLAFAAASGEPLAVLGVLACCLAVCGLLWARAARLRVSVTGHQIETVGFFRRQVHPRARAAHLVRATLLTRRGTPYPAVFVLDARGHLLARANGGTYAPEDLDRLAAYLGLPWSGPPHPVTAYRLRQMYPGTVPRAEANPVLIGCLVGAVLMVLLLVGGFTLAWFTRP